MSRFDTYGFTHLIYLRYIFLRIKPWKYVVRQNCIPFSSFCLYNFLFLNFSFCHQAVHRNCMCKQLKQSFSLFPQLLPLALCIFTACYISHSKHELHVRDLITFFLCTPNQTWKKVVFPSMSKKIIANK